MPTIEEMRAQLKASQNSPSIEEMRAQLKALEEKPTEVVNEAADIPATQRAFVKNFGGTTQEQVDYLKRNNPELEVKYYDGEIVAKKPSETAWKKLDPTGFTNPVEALQDLGDIGYDIGAGIGTSAAGAFSGLLGSVAGPVGALGAGAVGSAAVGGGLEAVRQAIGKGLGTAEISEKDIGISAGLSALGPLLFGTGATGKQIASYALKPSAAGKALERKGMGYVAEGVKPFKAQFEAAKGLIGETQRGLLSRTKDLIGFIPGTAPKETLKNATEFVSPKITKDLIESGLELNPTKKYTNQEIAVALTNQEKIGGFGDMASNTIYTVIEDKKRQIGDEIAKGLEKEAKTFDISQLKAGLEGAIEKAGKSEIPAIREQANAARKIAEQYFTPIETRQFFDEIGDPIANLKAHKGPVFDEAMNPVERRTLRAGIKTELSAVDAMKLNNALSDYLDYTKNPLAVERMSPAERQLRGIVGEAKDKLQDSIYNALKESGSPDMRNLYRRNREFFRNIYPKFSTPEKAVQTLNNLNNPSNKILKEKIKTFDSQYQTNIGELGNLAAVTKYFGDPSLEAVSSGGATSTGKILRTGEIAGSLGYIGALSTGMPGAGQLGAQVGRATGFAAASPAATAQYLKAITAGKRAAEATGADRLLQQMSRIPSKLPLPIQSSLTPTGLYQSAWQLMGGN
jgi:hypothetical protein